MNVPELSQDARELVGAGRRALRPSELDKQRVFAALSARMPPMGVQEQAQSLATTFDALIPVKVMGGVGALAALFVAAYLLQRPKAVNVVESTVLPNEVARVPEVIAPIPVTTLGHSAVERPITSSNPIPQKHTVSQSPKRTVAPAGERLGEEAALLMQAEKEYHAGRLRDALTIANEHARRFPSGVLKQEEAKLRERVLSELASAN